MEKKDIVDHLVYNNPYERFMIMILERLEKLEDRMENLDNKMSVVMGNLTCKNNKINIIFKLILDKRLDNEKIDDVYNFLYTELLCTQCFFSLDVYTSCIQIVCTDNDVFQKFSNMIDKFKQNFKISINSISIETDINLTSTSSDFYMIYKPSNSQAKKIKLQTA